MDDRDSPWKEALEQDLGLLFALLVPEIHASIDWTRNHETLEQELRKMVPQGGTGKRLADKLIRAFTQGGDDRIYHVEVQGDKEADFEHRVYVYFYRDEDRFGLPAEMIVILTDDDPTWRPNAYRVGLLRTTCTFTFEPIKLIDWIGREEELQRDNNPMGLFLLAHLYSLRTRQDISARVGHKFALIRNLRQRKMNGEEVRHWYRYLDWFLGLPVPQERELWDRIKQLEQEDNVPFVTFADRQGRQDGLAEGRLEGRLEGLLEGLEAVVEVKFGEAGLALLPQIRRHASSELIQQLLNSVRLPSTTLDSFREFVASAIKASSGE